MSFDAGIPTAVKIGLGRTDALTGKKFSGHFYAKRKS
jgi:hypothetical protein